MIEIIGVRFKANGKVYYFSPRIKVKPPASSPQSI